MTRWLIASAWVVSSCAAPVEVGSDEWEDIEDVVDEGAMTEEEWEAAFAAADAEDPDDPDALADPESVGAGTGELESGGPGPLNDPCKNPPDGYRVRHGTNQADHIVGTDERDIIFGHGGDDVIETGGGNDIVCGGFGRDRIRAGDGVDYVDGGPGKDLLWGGAGNDVIHGRGGSDVIHGGPGDDELYGDVLDDRLWGDGGNDVLIGGHGIDRMHGGAGGDWLRGDTNADEFYGGSGNDTASFMTAMPPGQPLPGVPVRPDGIVIRVGRELASGDGYKERVLDVENVIGSAFDDVMSAGDSSIDLFGGPGVDVCNGAECEPGMEASAGRVTAIAFVDARPRDTGLIVLGANGSVSDEIDVLMRGSAVHVIATGGTIVNGPGCDPVSDHEVSCTFDHPLRYLMAWGGDGNDIIRIGNGFPRDFTSHVGGGLGDDQLYGGNGQDVLFTGLTGRDLLRGGPGDDALIGESPQGPTPLGTAYAGGGDRFFGDEGNDQLVSDYPCGQHEFHGGRGLDIAGFARVGTHFPTEDLRRINGIRAQLGGHTPRSEQTAFYGRAYQPTFCDLALASTLGGDLEILEGAGGHDLLHGNGRSNFLWGWGGNDIMDGHGGNDVVDGHKENDRLIGGSGVDRLHGGIGDDVLNAQDGSRDAEIDCGPGPEGGETASRDGSRDPAPDRCGRGDGTGLITGECAGPRACTDANGEGVCVGDEGINTCVGGHRICTCTMDGWTSCGPCTPG